MFASITTYRRGDLVIEVLPGASHSAAWAAVTGAEPVRRARPQRPAGRRPGCVDRAATRRRARRRRALLAR